MDNNYVEQFLVGIGFDTKSTKRQAKAIDKLLNGMEKSRIKGTNKQSKLEEKVATKRKKTRKIEVDTDKINSKSKVDRIVAEHKAEAAVVKSLSKRKENVIKRDVSLHKVAESKKRAITDAKNSSTSANMEISNARIKQAVGNLTKDSSGKKINSKNTMFGAVDLKAEAKVKADAIAAEEFKNKSQNKRQIRRKVHRSELARARVAEDAKSIVDARAALMRRLAIRKASGVTTDFSRSRANKLNRGITESRAFHRTSEAGNLPRGFRQDLAKATAKGDLAKLRKLKFALQDASTAGKKLNATQRALGDSARNMMRTYVSVFALFQGTVAIKRVGQDFQGMEASMLAAAGSAPAAAKDMAFLNGVVDEMGLNLKDSSDAFVKLKFALKGKLDQSQIEELFKNVSMFGTALKIAPEDMKRAQRALIQIDCLAA
jgi:hypothetical protein